MQFQKSFTVLALLSPAALGQQTIDELFGAQAGDGFGTSVAFVGDLDHDGMADFAVGAPGDDSAGADAGSVTVFSGVDRTELFHWDGLQAGGRLGASVDGAGDVDLDGYDDVIAGAPGASQALVFSGRTGGILYNLAPGSGAEFGTSVAGIGLADADAWPDFAVGATAGTGLWVFSGQTGGIHWTSPVASLELSDLGDVNGDGFDDLIAGDYTHDFNGGRAVVFSGLTGATIRQHLGDNTFSDSLGKGVSGFGDIDGDAVGDYGYGVPCICFATHYAVVRSGASGALIHTLTEFTTGWDMAPGGDLDLDGTRDVLVATPGPLLAYSGASGLELSEFGNGVAVDGGSDADGDGLMDILSGAFSDDTTGNDAGRVSIYTLGCPYPEPCVNYCTAAANSVSPTGTWITYQNTLSISANHTRLVATDCPVNEFGVFYFGSAAIEIPFGNGFRCVGGLTSRISPPANSGAAGTATHLMNMTTFPASQITSGSTWYFQFWYRDPAAGAPGFNLSNGMELTFLP